MSIYQDGLLKRAQNLAVPGSRAKIDFSKSFLNKDQQRLNIILKSGPEKAIGLHSFGIQLGMLHLDLCTLGLGAEMQGPSDACLNFLAKHPAVLDCMVRYCVVSCGIVWYGIVLYRIALHCIVLYCIVLYCIVYYCIAI